ncbi:hypothetical protein BBD42_05110 [Paenibacillus sp. BIHB 4019]|uniref:Uncharacterized protein n=1 Tax=Paenibacillus sp. BIHB 4019 TaxID=1870819 RepID=A0A1B2DDY7_9BACL|nr:hypothetical protein [Paenibacillus sp. BIHB 4019]ANY65916.1 hypothetical protein BBD42_05110 [Paenibacillus sp. BIHB 4019]
MTNPSFRIVGELSSLVLAIFFISNDFIFLGALIIVGIISDFILHFGVKMNSSSEEARSSLFKKVGHYAYLFSLGYIAVMLFLVQFKFLSAELALYFIFFGAILLFPLIALFQKK